MTNLWKRERGQALVELAILLPILLVILLGVIDFGRVFYAYVTITNASREGARYGSLNPPISTENCDEDCEGCMDIKQRAIDEAANTVTIDISKVTVSCDDPDHPSTITVTVDFEFETLFFGNLPFIRDWFDPGGKVPISVLAEMPVAP